MNKIEAATAKVIELIQAGRTEIWSAELGDFTRAQVKEIVKLLMVKGYRAYWIVNAHDNGIVIK